jgi:hypothetical protein
MFCFGASIVQGLTVVVNRYQKKLMVITHDNSNSEFSA